MAPVFALNATSFVVFAGVLAWAHVGRKDAPARRERFLPALRAGGGYVRWSPYVRHVLIRAALFLLPATAIWALLPLVATEALHLDAAGYGVLLAALGLGAIGGVLVGAIGLSIAMPLGEIKLYGWASEAAAQHILSDLAQVLFALAISAWIGGMAKQSVERRQLIEELERTRRELASAEREAGVLEERGRLAREIHDTLAQGFASIVAHLEAARGSLGHDPERVERHVVEAEEVARHSLADARALAWALRPEALGTGGLPAAVERAAATMFRGTGVKTSVTVTGPVHALHPNVEVTLLRAAQEALANVHRHAAAHEVVVTLSYFDDAVSLDVADDGLGFDPERTSPGPAGGLGLIGIRERAEALGGSVAIESTAGRGTTIAVNVPTQVPQSSQRRSDEAHSSSHGG